MFSGIVEECARVVGIVKEQENVHFTLSCSFVDELKIDQSVSHNGVCLTVVRIQDGTYTVTAMKETLDRSNLGRLKVGENTFTIPAIVSKDFERGGSLYVYYAASNKTSDPRNKRTGPLYLNFVLASITFSQDLIEAAFHVILNRGIPDNN